MLLFALMVTLRSRKIADLDLSVNVQRRGRRGLSFEKNGCPIPNVLTSDLNNVNLESSSAMLLFNGVFQTPKPSWVFIDER